MKLDQNVCLVEISVEFENGSCWIKKLGHILEKPCVHSRGPIFSLIIMKLDQHICRDKTSHKFENGSCWVKN